MLCSKPRRLAVGLALLASLACNEQSQVPAVCAPARFGTLEGYVRVGGEGIAATIGARSVTSYDVHFETRSDRTGWYHLEVSADTYRIEIAPGGRGYLSRDTVRVEPGPRRLNILRGKLTVLVTATSAMEGRFALCTLDPVEPPWDHQEARAVARGGLLEFFFPLVEAGKYRIALGQDRPLSFWFPGTSDPAAAAQISVTVDRPLVYEGNLDRYASISGSVRGSWQETHSAGPEVIAYSLDSKRLSRGWAFADGSFTLDLFSAQPVRLQTDINGIQQWIGGDSFETATVFNPRPGDELKVVSVIESGILCRLEGPGFLSNHYAQVLLRDAAGRTYKKTADGNPFSICNLRPGRYFLYVYGYCTGQNWASQWFDGADSLEAATPIDLTEGKLVPITLQLVAGGTIAGRVLTAGGVPAVPTGVQVFDRGGVALCDDTYQYSRDGTFSLRGLGNGDYTLAARTAQGFWWYPGTALLDSARVVRIRNHATVAGIEWRLPQAGTEAWR